MRKFALCRICFRNLALGGELPGVGQGELVEVTKPQPFRVRGSRLTGVMKR